MVVGVVNLVGSATAQNSYHAVGAAWYELNRLVQTEWQL